MVDTTGYGTKEQKGTAVLTKKDGTKIYLKDSKVVKEINPQGKKVIRFDAPSPSKGKSRVSAVSKAVKVTDLKSIATQNKVLKETRAQDRWLRKVSGALRDVQTGNFNYELSDNLKRLLLEQSNQRTAPLIRTRAEQLKSPFISTKTTQEAIESARVQKELGRLVESKVLRPEIRQYIGMNAQERQALRDLASAFAKEDPTNKFLNDVKKKTAKLQSATEKSQYIKEKLFLHTGNKGLDFVSQFLVELGSFIPQTSYDLGALGVYGVDMGLLYLKNIYGKDQRARTVAVQTFNNNLKNVTSKDFGRSFFKNLDPRTPSGLANVIFLLHAFGGAKPSLKALNKNIVKSAKFTTKQLNVLNKVLKSSKVRSVIKDFRTRSLFTKIAIDPKTRKLLFTGRTTKVTIPTKTGTVIVKGFNTKTLSLTPKLFTTVNNSISRVLQKFPTVRKFYTPNLRKAVLLIEDKNGYLLRTISLNSAKNFRVRASRLLVKELQRLNSNLLRLGRKVSLTTLKNKITIFFTGLKSKLNDLFNKIQLQSAKVKGIVIRGKKIVFSELKKAGVTVKNIKTDFVNKFPKTFTVYDKEAGKLAKFIIKQDGRLVRVLNVRTLGGLRRQYGRLVVRELNKLNKSLISLSKNTTLVFVTNRIKSFFNSLQNKLSLLFKKFGLIKSKIKGAVVRVSNKYSNNLKKLGFNARDIASLKKLRLKIKGRVGTVYDKNVGDLTVLLLKKEGDLAKAFSVVTAKKIGLVSRRLVRRELGRLTRGVLRVKSSSKTLNYLSKGFGALKKKLALQYDSVLSKVRSKRVAKLLKKNVLKIEFKNDLVINKPTTLTKYDISLPKEIKKTTAKITITPKKTILISPDGQQLVVVSKSVTIPLKSTVKRVVVIKSKKLYDSYARLLGGIASLTSLQLNKLSNVTFNGIKFNNIKIKSLLRGNIPNSIIDFKETQKLNKKIAQNQIKNKKSATKSKSVQKEKFVQKIAQKEAVKQLQRQRQDFRQSQLQRYLQRLRTILRSSKRRIPKRISFLLKKPKLSLKDKEELVLWVKSFQKRYRPSLSAVIFGFTGFKMPKSTLLSPVTARRIVSNK